MLTQAQIPLNATVSFDLHPSAVLGTGYKGAKVLAILDADSCRYFNVDPVAMHANVYPMLPPGTPNKYDGYPWVKLKLASGQITCIGLPWIIDATFSVDTTSSLRFTVQNVSPEQRNIIMEALSANGFTAVNVEVLD